MTQMHIIRTERDYASAIVEYETYFDDEPAMGSPEAERFERLGLLLAKYEEDPAPLSSSPVS